MDPGPLSAFVGRRLRELRLRAGITITRLAKRVGLSASVLQRIEDGGAHPSVGTLNDLAGQLGTSVAELVRHARGDQAAPRASRAPSGPAQIGRAILDLPEGTDKLRVAEAAAVSLALEVCKGNKSAAARLLGAQRKAFVRLLERPARKTRA